MAADGKKGSREGLVMVSFWADPDLRDAIKRLGIDAGKSVQDLMTEAADDLLQKHKKRAKPKG